MNSSALTSVVMASSVGVHGRMHGMYEAVERGAQTSLRAAASEVRDHGFARRVERRLRSHAVCLANAMDAHAICRRGLVRFELCAELACDHAARFIDLHHPRAAHELQVVVERARHDFGTE